jgi:hypothetical protein
MSLMCFQDLNRCRVIIDFSTRNSINRFNRLEILIFRYCLWLIRIQFYLSKIKIHVEVDGSVWVSLEFRNSLLDLGCFAGSMVGPTIRLFFCPFFWRSSLLECCVQSYVRSHWFGCSLLPGTPLNSPWNMALSSLSWSRSLALLIKEQQP